MAETFWRIVAVTIIIELGLILRALWELKDWFVM
jgi:hypothetical protein